MTKITFVYFHFANNRDIIPSEDIYQACSMFEDVEVGSTELYFAKQGFSMVVVLYGREYQDFSPEERLYFQLTCPGKICTDQEVCQADEYGPCVVQRYRKWAKEGIVG